MDGDRAELRRVHKAIRRAEIHFVQRVEEFSAELELHAFDEAEFPRERQVQRLQTGADNRVAADVAESERQRRRKRLWIEPLRGGVCAGTKNWLAEMVRGKPVCT